MKVLDLHNYIMSRNTQLIPSNTVLNCMVDYNANHAIYDAKLADYKSLRLLDVDKDVEEMTTEIFSDIQKHIQMMLLMNKYKYDGLFKTLSFEYNPIFNTEWTQTDKFGKQSIEDINGKTKETSNYGEHNNINIDEFGIGKETITIGGKNSSDTYGSKVINDDQYEDINIHESNGYNSFTGTPDGKDTLNAGARKHTEEGYTDSHEEQEAIDTRETDAKTDKHSSKSDSYVDTRETDEFINKHNIDAYENSITKSGNIGVMSTQDLIGQERQIVDWSFWEVLYNDIINEICSLVWEKEA